MREDLPGGGPLSTQGYWNDFLQEACMLMLLKNDLVVYIGLVQVNGKPWFQLPGVQRTNHGLLLLIRFFVLHLPSARLSKFLPGAAAC